MTDIFVLNLEVTTDGKLRCDSGVNRKNHFFSTHIVNSDADVVAALNNYLAKVERLKRNPVEFELTIHATDHNIGCLLYTSDAADE